MWWVVLIAVSVLGLTWGVYVVYLDIKQYRDLQRRRRKEREKKELSREEA